MLLAPLPPDPSFVLATEAIVNAKPGFTFGFLKALYPWIIISLALKVAVQLLWNGTVGGVECSFIIAMIIFYYLKRPTCYVRL